MFFYVVLVKTTVKFYYFSKHIGIFHENEADKKKLKREI